MSTFTDTALIRKLGDLNSSQQSIQTLSLWLIHHRRHHSTIVKTWLRELQNAPEGKKLTFMYLANDVIQNSKKKGPEYGKEFSTVLSRVFAHMGENCRSDKVIGSLGRILTIWEERGVYDDAAINEYRARLNREHVESSNDANGNTPPDEESHSDRSEKREKHEKHEKHERREKREKIDKRKHENERARRDEKKKHRGSPVVEEKRPEQNGKDSPVASHVDAPEPQELIAALMKVENSASSDADVRERIANLPPEISDINCLSKLEDKEQARQLSKQVNSAITLLNDYNGRLAEEMEDRTKLAQMLRDFEAEQKELLLQAEKRMEEYKKKLARMSSLQRSIRDHLSNLPDLKQLPDVTGGLAPLPSAGDLFSLH